MASRFWVGGTGTWDNVTTTHWSAATGGAGGASVPAAVDGVTFDGASGGGTVTLAATINGTNTVGSFTGGAFTGTIDFSAAATFTTTGTFSFSGAGTRTITGGSCNFIMNSGVDFTTLTGATLSLASSTFTIQTAAASRSFITGGGTYGNIIISAGAAASSNNSFFLSLPASATTFTSLSLIGPLCLTITQARTLNLSNPPTWTGSASLPIFVGSGNPNSSTPLVTIAVNSGQPALSWVALSCIVFTVGTSGTATNSFDCSNNSGITITGPSGGGGGGGFVIGS